MALFALMSGSYEARSLIANAQRCVNLYAEKNPQDSPYPFTYYPTPGLIQLSACPTPGLARCLYQTSQNALYAVVGATVYAISSAYVWTALGTIPYGTTPVSMADNGVTMIIVDGSASGWQIVLATNTFSQITDENFLGSTRADYIDTYFLLNQPGTPNFYISLSEAVSFDSLDFAAKTGAADSIVAAISIHDEIALIGTQTTEVWDNTGAADFTFAKQAGVFLEHGCDAPFSIAKSGTNAGAADAYGSYDSTLFWISRNRQGQGTVVKTAGYNPTPISTQAMQYEFASYPTLADAVGYTYQQNGHLFYKLHFPSADKTWVWDDASNLWHEQLSVDSNGEFHRHRGTFGTFCYGMNLELDWQTGALYEVSAAAFADNGLPITRIRSWPHMVNNGVRVRYDRFVVDMDVGQTVGALVTSPAVVSVRWSDTKGASWGNPVEVSLGSTGQYLTSAQVRRCGMARDRVFEVSWSFGYSTALNGAYVDATAAAS